MKTFGKILLCVALLAPRNYAQLPIAGTTRQLTTNPAAQTDPAISGNLVVWVDQRNGNDDIYLLDLLTGVETQVTTSAANQRLNDISGTRIVYTDFGFTAGRVMLYDVSTGLTSILGSGPADSNPRVDGTIAVFERSQSDIYAVDVTTGAEIPVATSSSVESNASISGTRVVFQRNTVIGAQGDIVMVDLATMTETVIGGSAADERHPDISGNLVVWEFIVDNGDIDIGIHDLSTGVTQVLTLPGNQRIPKVSGRFVTFDDDASGNSNITLYRVDSGEFFTAAGSADAEFLNDISESRIVYVKHTAGNLDIWLYEFPDIEVSPASVNFGSAPIGAQSTAIVTIANTGGPGLVVNSVSLSGSAAFSILAIRKDGSNVSAPLSLASGETADVELSFIPPAAGGFSGSLNVACNDAGEGSVEVALSGQGVQVQTPPGQQIDDILAFFDTSVRAGSLAGTGGGNSAPGRLKALHNMIEAAGDLIAEGNLGEACAQLKDILYRMDGNPQPPDFSIGDALAELRTRVTALRTALGCP